MTQLTIGITGPGGFIGGHLARRLQREEGVCVVPIGRTAFQDPASLCELVRKCDCIVHLAGMSRGDEQEIYRVNMDLSDRLLAATRHLEKPLHIVFASSTQRTRDNSYGRSKRDCEQQLTAWAAEPGCAATILVIPNVFGPGCRPYHNSVVATFCHQLTHGETPVVLEDREIPFVWINDLVEEIRRVSAPPPEAAVVCNVPATALLTTSALLAKLTLFRAAYFDDNLVPDLAEPLETNLYTTFLSHVELNDHSHSPTVHSDDRGRLYEVIRLATGGQVFFSTTKPGVVRGNHFHTRKVEWFCVVRGEAAIRMRRVADNSVHEFLVRGETPQFISIPPLHTHQIENVGSDDLLTMFWCNEVFQPNDPDTFYEQVA